MRTLDEQTLGEKAVSELYQRGIEEIVGVTIDDLGVNHACTSV